MANKMFQKARETVREASSASPESMDRAKNALSSAYANSTDAEKVQLRELQQELESR
ncbi:DUF3813 family protein [Bacillus mangrovi]|uniref:DUF3813 family protein n=1 Tax=Metabacillus mangrovi TaxID=1491830 RepID=A0A7X2S4J1_9BACI|nr:DUF3813 domain-containing protein [Metabacillus mangrovi]MTH53272.1 DUF3813 family protein [Metabacillus mangrovi]